MRPVELTIDELARRSGMTGRNIRQWQTDGLLPPPHRRGRVGVYGEDHLARINRIKELRVQGFPLDLIRRVLDAPGLDAEAVEADVRHLAAGALAPFAGAERVVLTSRELDRRLGDGVAGPLQDAGIAEPSPDGYTLDGTVLTFLEAATAAGMPAAALARAMAKAHDHQRAIAAVFLEAVRDEVWRPFVDAGLPSERMRALADTVDRLREIGVAAQSYMHQRALDEVLTGVLVEEAARLRNQLPHRDS
jgi:DNA-binding transcriptional MerR regulator